MLPGRRGHSSKPWPGSQQCHFSSRPTDRGWLEQGLEADTKHSGPSANPGAVRAPFSSACSVGDAVKGRQNSESSLPCPFFPGISAEFPALLSRC